MSSDRNESPTLPAVAIQIPPPQSRMSDKDRAFYKYKQADAKVESLYARIEELKAGRAKAGMSEDDKETLDDLEQQLGDAQALRADWKKSYDQATSNKDKEYQQISNFIQQSMSLRALKSLLLSLPQLPVSQSRASNRTIFQKLPEQQAQSSQASGRNLYRNYGNYQRNYGNSLKKRNVENKLCDQN